MGRRLSRNLWFVPLILSYVLFSYYFFGRWWDSSVGTILIILFSYMIWKKDFLEVIGMKVDFYIGIKSLLLTGIIVFSSLLMMKYIVHNLDIIIRFDNWRNYYHGVFYILNEDIILGAIILFVLVRKRKVRPIVASAGLAVVFSLIHYVFYRWIFVDNLGILETSTLITLFLVGLVRNNLILQTGHIGYSWALHFGWMSMMFGNIHLYNNSQVVLTEPLRFNTYLGSIEMLIISFILALFSLIYWIKKYKTWNIIAINS